MAHTERIKPATRPTQEFLGTSFARLLEISSQEDVIDGQLANPELDETTRDELVMKKAKLQLEADVISQDLRMIEQLHATGRIILSNEDLVLA